MMLAERREFGFATLGPVVAEYIRRLDTSLNLLHDRFDQALFLSRGGARLLHLYRIFLQESARELPLPCEPILLSRLTSARAEMVQNYEGMNGPVTLGIPLVRELLRLLDVRTPADWVRGLRTSCSCLSYQRCLARGEMQLPGSDWASADCFLARQLKSRAEALRNALTPNGEATVLVDTGLKASAHASIARAFPDMNLATLLIAKDSTRTPAPISTNVVGLMCDAPPEYDPDIPATCLFDYWHLLEALFEPPIPTVWDSDGVTAWAPGAAWNADTLMVAAGKANSAMYAGVLDYFLTGRCAVAGDFPSAMADLSDRITSPSERDIGLLTVGCRRDDFGDLEQVPVFYGLTASSGSLESPESLWPSGVSAYRRLLERS
jgi:hypothetical protein